MRWRLADAILAVLAGILGATVALTFTGPPTTEEAFLVVLPAQEAATLVALLIISRLRGSGNLIRDFGLRWRPQLGWVVAAGVAIQIVMSLILAAVTNIDEAPQEISQLVDAATGFTALAAVILSVIIVPFVEELVFRGLLLGALADRWNVWAAIVVTAAAFAVSHYTGADSLIVIGPLFVLGIFLGALARWRGLADAVALHVGFNALAAIVFVST